MNSGLQRLNELRAALKTVGVTVPRGTTLKQCEKMAKKHGVSPSGSSSRRSSSSKSSKKRSGGKNIWGWR